MNSNIKFYNTYIKNFCRYGNKSSAKEEILYKYCKKICPKFKIIRNIRPDIINITFGTNEFNKRRNLEFDIYIVELKTAIEFNGYQHYTYPNIFHKTEQDFEKQLLNDTYKKQLCDKYGINLIVINENVLNIYDELRKEISKIYIYEPSKFDRLVSYLFSCFKKL